MLARGGVGACSRREPRLRESFETLVEEPACEVLALGGSFGWRTDLQNS